MSEEFLKVVAPVSHSAHEIRMALPRSSDDSFSQQVADYISAKEEKKRQSRERPLLHQAALSTALGAGLGGVLGGLKAIPITQEAWNPWAIAAGSAIGGAAALGSTVLRQALKPSRQREADRIIAESSPSVSYVAEHSAIARKAKEMQLGKLAPFVGLEVGTTLGAIGGLLGAQAFGKQPASGDPMLVSGIGAIAGGVAGLGLGYLYSKKKDKNFREHVQQMLEDMRSQKAQEAITQASTDIALPKTAGAVTAFKRRKGKGTDEIPTWAKVLAGAGGAATLGGLALMTPSQYKNLSTFSDTLKTWDTVSQDPRQLNKSYAILGANALQGSLYDPVALVKAYRSSPFSNIPWSPGSGRHYEEFTKGPVHAYLQIAGETSDLEDTSATAKNFRANLAAMASVAAKYVDTGKLRYPDWLVPSSIQSDSKKLNRFESRLKEVLDDVGNNIPKDERGVLDKVFLQKREVPGFSAKDVEPELRGGLSRVSQALFNQPDLNKLDYAQQTKLIAESDPVLKQLDPALWAKKQLFDAGVGISRYEGKNFYPKYIDPARDARNAMLYGGLGLLAIGGGVMLSKWWKRKKEESADKETSNTIEFPLRKAANELVKNAIDGIRRPPVVASNAGLLRGMGGPPDRFAAGKLGAKRVYAQALDDLQSFFKRADDTLDVQNSGEDDQLLREIAKVLEEAYPAREIQPSPSQKIAEKADTDLPYRKRVEVIAVKDGKVYGGLYENKTFGLFGGGLDGDDIIEAAQREFLEESGKGINNPRVVPAAPFKMEWEPPYESAKQEERAKKYRGSETHWVMADFDGDVTENKASGSDGASGLKSVRLYDLAEIEDSLSNDDGGKYSGALAARVEAIRRALGQEKKADAVSLMPRKEVLYFTPAGKLAIKRLDNRRVELPADVDASSAVPYELPVVFVPESGVPEKGVHGYNISLHTAEGELPEGFEETAPESALQDLYASLGKPENRAYASLDRARARALLRILKKRSKPAAV